MPLPGRAPRSRRQLPGASPTASDAAALSPLSFLIVGTSHSGTTLVQRLAAELPGVRVPPETHFLESFAHGLLRRRRFPIGADGIGEEVARFARLPTSLGMELDAAAVERELGGSCRTPLDLFAAIVRALAPDGVLHGEKTPLHLLWWRPLAEAWPTLKLVGVVRDPRAVVASHVGVPWGWVPHVLAAERWAADQRELARARRALGDERLLVVRYEDVVADPEGARARLAAFLGVENVASELGSSPLFLEWEGKKQRALAPVDTARVAAWRESLAPREVEDTTAICRGGMVEFGYGDAAPSRRRAMRRLAALSPLAQATRARFRVTRARDRLAIRRARLIAGAAER